MPSDTENSGGKRRAKPLPAAFEMDITIRRLVAEAISRCEKSRDQIGDDMSYLLGRRITVHILNLWTAESKDEYRIPLNVVAAFCEVTGDRRLLECVAAKLGLSLVGEQDAYFLALGRAYAAAQQHQKSLIAVEAQVLLARGGA